MPADELKGVKLEPSKVAVGGVVCDIGRISNTSRKKGKRELGFMDIHVYIPAKMQ